MAVLLWAGTQTANAGGSTTLDGIAAVIGPPTLTQEEVREQIITRSEVTEMARPLIAKMTQQSGGTAVDPEKITKRVLEELILRRLREQEAHRLKVGVTDADLEGVMREMERKNRLPVGALPAALAKQGIQFQSFRQDMIDQLVKSRLINKVIRPFVTVSDEEVMEAYRTYSQQPRSDEIRLGQIVLGGQAGSKPEQSAEVVRQAEHLVAQLKKGTPMAALAGQYSEGPNALKGGDMGWFKRGVLPAQLEKAVFDLPVGSVVGPARSQQGILIFQVLERRADPAKGGSAPPPNQTKASHILLKLSSEAGADEVAEKLEKIRDLRKKLEGGAVFADLAKQHSEDGSAALGGDLGWFGPGVMVPEFEEAVSKLAKGELSQPVRTPFGWHLVRLTDRRVVAPNSLEAKRGELEQQVRENKVQERFQQWMRDLRLRAYIEFR